MSDSPVDQMEVENNSSSSSSSSSTISSGSSVVHYKQWKIEECETDGKTPDEVKSPIFIETNDTKLYLEEEEPLLQCVTLKNMFDDIAGGSKEERLKTIRSVPLPNISSQIWSRLRKYLYYHHEHPEVAAAAENDDSRKDDICVFDADFTKVDQPTLFELILAANYLDNKSCLDLLCKTVANMIKGKSPEEIRKTFNIKNDFTPEEEEQVRRENAWCEER